MNHLTATYGEIQFSDADVVNFDDYIGIGGDPHNVRPWLLHDHGFVLAVVFADSLQDAIDIAADAGKLDQFRIQPEEEPDYLGNHCVAYDIQGIDALELPNPPLSFVALFLALTKKEILL